MENRNYINKIDALLNGKLSADDRTAFREEITKDTALEQEVKEHVLEREAIKLLLKEDYKTQIKAWRAEGSAGATATTSTAHTAKERTLKPQVRTRSLRPILSAAASILLLVVGGFWFANNNYSNTALITDTYIDANTVGDKGGNKLEENLQNGLAFYIDKDYDTAIRSFRAAGNTVDANYYLGHSHFKLGEYGEAVGYFNKVLAIDDLPSHIKPNQLEYNRLLAQVGAEDTGATFQQNLEQLIQNGQPPYNTKAQALKDKMESFWRNFTF